MPVLTGNYTMPQLLAMLTELNEMRANKVAAKNRKNASGSLSTAKDTREGVAKAKQSVEKAVVYKVKGQTSWLVMFSCFDIWSR